LTVIIPDYGCGNLASVVRMVETVGGEARIVQDPDDLKRADKIVLAGVGAFDHGAQSLSAGHWMEPLNEAVLGRGTPVLGICLGMQLMCKSSTEGALPGLGWFDADVERFAFPDDSGLKVPHMGWNTLRVEKANSLLTGEEEQRFYFVHSYYIKCHDDGDILATSHHGFDFTAAISRDQIFGVQFHPEKSHRFGRSVMKRFVEF